MDDILRAAAQTVVIEAARAYVEGTKRPIDMANAGQLAGHLMAAEVLLAEIVKAFEEPRAEHADHDPQPLEDS
ncbi:hypothetical protein AB4Z54_18420 [Streptomyces sp. MCAF7]